MNFLRVFKVAILISLIIPPVFAEGLTGTQGTITKYETEVAVLSGVSIAKSLSGYSGTLYKDGGSFDNTGL